MTTISTLLSGGECVGVGAREAGLSHLWGFEIEDAIAQVARDNGFNVITADVMELDPAALEVPDVLHASPVCKRASGANQSAELNEDGTKEAPEDIEMGQKIASFIEVMTPQVFTLENVYAYRNFKAFKIICAALNRNGYMWDFDNLNAADYGVPQTRRRLILRAKRGALLPNLPQPEKWIGWYEAIEDLIPGLPESRFAPWQLERLPKNTISFVVGSQYGQPQHIQDRIPQIRLANEPYFTSTVSSGQHNDVRAWLADVQNTGRTLTVLTDSEPSFTIQAGTMRRLASTPRGWLSQGHVVSMSSRALARFQSIPDNYALPQKNTLACKVIGNGVPCLLYQKIIEPLAA